MAEESIGKVEVRCPICSEKGLIEVNLVELQKMERGLLAINVSKDRICEHTFIAYIDKNLNVRDCYTADFTLDVAVEEKGGIRPENVDLSMIKINFSEEVITELLRSVIFGKKILIFSDQTNLAKHITELFEFITENSFDFNITFKSKKEYRDGKKKYSDYIIFEPSKLVKDKEKVIESKKMKIENQIIKKFYEETDLISSLIILKNEVQKLHEMASGISKIIKENDQKQLNSKFFVNELKERQGAKITVHELELLLDIARNYFGLEFKKLSDASDFLGFL